MNLPINLNALLPRTLISPGPTSPLSPTFLGFFHTTNLQQHFALPQPSRPPKSGNAPFLNLPPELILLIASYLEIREWRRLSYTNRRVHQILARSLPEFTSVTLPPFCKACSAGKRLLHALNNAGLKRPPKRLLITIPARGREQPSRPGTPTSPSTPTGGEGELFADWRVEALGNKDTDSSTPNTPTSPRSPGPFQRSFLCEDTTCRLRERDLRHFLSASATAADQSRTAAGLNQLLKDLEELRVLVVVSSAVAAPRLESLERFGTRCSGAGKITRSPRVSAREPGLDATLQDLFRPLILRKNAVRLQTRIVGKCGSERMVSGKSTLWKSEDRDDLGNLLPVLDYLHVNSEFSQRSISLTHGFPGLMMEDEGGCTQCWSKLNLYDPELDPDSKFALPLHSCTILNRQAPSATDNSRPSTPMKSQAVTAAAISAIPQSRILRMLGPSAFISTTSGLSPTSPPIPAPPQMYSWDKHTPLQFSTLTDNTQKLSFLHLEGLSLALPSVDFFFAILCPHNSSTLILKNCRLVSTDASSFSVKFSIPRFSGSWAAVLRCAASAQVKLKRCELERLEDKGSGKRYSEKLLRKWERILCSGVMKEADLGYFC